MRPRSLLLAGLAAGLLVAAPATADTPPTAPVAQLRDYDCQRALDPLLRGVSVTAVMRPLVGTMSMRVRFDLLRAAHRLGAYHTVRARNLGDWIAPSDPTLGQQPGDVWIVPHPVVGLPAPAFYKLRVSYRWLGAGGRHLAQQTRVTRVCHQLELRPDLRAVDLEVFSLASRPGEYAYVAAVRNHGLSGAGPFEVQLSIPGSGSVTKMVGRLAPRSGRRVHFVAAACQAGSRITVTADPVGVVDDYDRANNAVTAACPANPPGYTP